MGGVGGKLIGGLAVNGALEINYCPQVLVSTLRGRFDYVILSLWVIARFCGRLHDMSVAMLVHP